MQSHFRLVQLALVLQYLPLENLIFANLWAVVGITTELVEVHNL